jgi:RND family efflux transporter MFP subunit
MFRANFIIANSLSKSGFKSLIIVCGAVFFACPFAVAQTPQQAMQVDAIYPQQVNNNQTIVLTGTVEAKQHAQLAPLEAGRVATLDVEIGDQVSSGQLLLSLDNQLAMLEVQGANADVNVAEVNLQEAQRLYQEAQRLSAQNVVAKTLIAERAALVASSEAQLARAKASMSLQQERLNRHSLTAPFDGVIAQRNVDVGEWITPQSAVLVLVAQDELRLAVEIPQQYYSQLISQSDVPIQVLPDAPGSQPLNATLSRLVPISDSATRTFLAQVDLPNNDSLVPGMSARAEITLPNSLQTSITLPLAAIKQHPDGGSSVFIAENGVAKRVITTYTAAANGQVTIQNQAADKAYIITGVAVLQDGMPVTVNVVDANLKQGEG